MLVGPLATPARAGESSLGPQEREWLEALFRQGDRTRAQAAQDPLYAGLPDRIARDYPEKEGFVRFSEIPGDNPPIGGRIRFSDPNLKLRDVFEEESWARLPDGARITGDLDGEKPSWDYPVGTRVMHRFWFKTEPRKLFELRLVQKLQSGKWAFGMYVAEDGTEELPLHREGSPPLTFDVVIAGKNVHVDMFRLSPASCRACHWMRGHGNHQFPDMEHVGPCGFVPANADLPARWAKAYETRHGYFPFGRR